MSVFADGIIGIYNYFTDSANSFVVQTGTSPRKFVIVQPEAEDTIEKLAQKVRDRIEEEGGTWIKRHRVLPTNPSEPEKEFDEAIEWIVACTKFDNARASMMRSTLSKKYGEEHGKKLFAYVSQAIQGDATIRSKPWFGVNGSSWQAHKNLAGMAREKAMRETVEEVARQKKLFRNETIVPVSQI